MGENDGGNDYDDNDGYYVVEVDVVSLYSFYEVG